MQKNRPNLWNLNLNCLLEQISEKASTIFERSKVVTDYGSSHACQVLLFRCPQIHIKEKSKTLKIKIEHGSLFLDSYPKFRHSFGFCINDENKSLS
jgi:hypothetical protein